MEKTSTKSFFLFLALLLINIGFLKAQTVYATSQTNGANGVCLFCSVINPGNATDGSNSTYSKLNLTVGLLGAEVHQDVSFPSAASAGNYVSAIVEDDNLGLLSVSALGGLQISTALGGLSNGDNNSGASISISLLAGSTTKYVISFLACCGFDKVHIQLNAGIASAVTKLRVYSVSYGIHPLPVELLYFNANYDKHIVTFSWATATEHNSDFYTVERTVDGNSYEQVATKKGAGNSSMKIEYSAQDNAPVKGTAYYRLEQTDYDGQSQYSNVVTVVNNDETTDLSVRPAQKGQINVSIDGLDANESTTIAIYNILGMLVYTQALDQGETSAEINPDKSFDAGIYFMIASTAKNIVKQQKLIVN